mgnify:FL=1
MKNSLYIAKRTNSPTTDIIGEQYTRLGECKLWILASFPTYFDAIEAFKAVSDKGIYRKDRMARATMIHGWTGYDMVDCYDARQ